MNKVCCRSDKLLIIIVKLTIQLSILQINPTYIEPDLGGKK